MQNNILSPYSHTMNMRTYNILGELSLRVTVEQNPFDLPLDALFQMAARINKKRSFLFVSKVLGKHIPINPYVSLLSGGALALLLAATMKGQASNDAVLAQAFDPVVRGLTDPESAREAYDALIAQKLALPEPVTIIGFAETATALGHAVFRAFADGCAYVTTTREFIPALRSVADFDEEHSHAVAQRCYASERYLNHGNPVVLVDDEITTGKTALNIIRALHAKYPRKAYYLASLLDWRTADDVRRFRELEAELGISIHPLSLIKGLIEVEGAPLNEPAAGQEEPALVPDADVDTIRIGRWFAQVPAESFDSRGEACRVPYVQATGRFGTESADHMETDGAITEAAQQLRALRSGGRALCLGTGEFMYLPMRIAAEMGEGIAYHSTTRSPVYPYAEAPYAVRDAHPFPCPEDPDIPNFVYNLKDHGYEEAFVFLERELPAERLVPLAARLVKAGVPKIRFVFCSQAIHEFKEAQPVNIISKPPIPAPKPMGSYAASDVVFLLKNLNHVALERSNEDREEMIQSGVHYSEMLPVEYQPTPEYLALFHETLRTSARKVALAAGIVAERIVRRRGRQTVLVSLARAGTPIGILIKRYIRQTLQADLPHYSISIIRGKGIDENALHYILQQHPGAELQFVDGWTGKGAIRKVLVEACAAYRDKHGIVLDDDLAVLADPGCCSATYGTREDYLIPSACLNSTVSGLVSRTVMRADLIGPDDFHGAKYYEEWTGQDVSNEFIETVASYFSEISGEAKAEAERLDAQAAEVTWQGLADIQAIQTHYGIADMNLVKPGIGETTRVLLRRVPWKILVDRLDNPNLEHIRILAQDRNVPIEVFPGLTYSCCGLIKPLKGASE